MKKIPFFFKVVIPVLLIGFPLFLISAWETGQIPTNSDSKTCA